MHTVKASNPILWVARASRVLAMTSRHRGLPLKIVSTRTPALSNVIVATVRVISGERRLPSLHVSAACRDRPPYRLSFRVLTNPLPVPGRSRLQAAPTELR